MKATHITILMFGIACVALPCMVGAQDVEEDTGPPVVIVWGGGRWTQVQMVEDRNGTIIYQKMDASRPVAAKQDSVDVSSTAEVNQALRDFYTACNGNDVNLGRIFELDGRSRRIFMSIASGLSRTCFETLRARYQNQRSAGADAPVDRQLSDVARDVELQRGADAGTSISNDNLLPALDQGEGSGSGLFDGGMGSDAWARLRAYGVSEQTIKDNCAVEWPNDPKRREECVEDQAEAAYAIHRRTAVSSGIDGDAFDVIRQECAGDYHEDYEMRNYCEKSEIEALKEVRSRGAEIAAIDPRVLEQIRAHCRAEWPNDFSMQNYCEEEKIKELRHQSSTR